MSIGSVRDLAIMIAIINIFGGWVQVIKARYQNGSVTSSHITQIGTKRVVKLNFKKKKIYIYIYIAPLKTNSIGVNCKQLQFSFKNFYFLHLKIIFSSKQFKIKQLDVRK